jgi:hypothetical protein
MYLVHFFDQRNYEFIMSLHSTLAAAEGAFEALLRHYVIEDGEALPPKATWDELFDDSGESPHLYKIEYDGEPAEKISLSNSEDLATA